MYREGVKQVSKEKLELMETEKAVSVKAIRVETKKEVVVSMKEGQMEEKWKE